MSKVGIFFTDLAINIIIGIEWGIFIVLYSAVELFNKIFKNGNMSKIELLKEKYNEYSKLLSDVNEIINTEKFDEELLHRFSRFNNLEEKDRFIFILSIFESITYIAEMLDVSRAFITYELKRINAILDNKNYYIRNGKKVII